MKKAVIQIEYLFEDDISDYYIKKKMDNIEQYLKTVDISVTDEVYSCIKRYIMDLEMKGHNRREI